MENLSIESTWDVMFQMARRRWLLVAICFVLGAGFFVIFPPIGAVIILAPFGYFYLKAHQEFMEGFAAHSGMEYTEHGALEDCRGRLFDIGHSRGVTNTISGHWNNYPIKLFNYAYTTGSGKSQQRHAFTVLEISFAKIEFPYIFLQAKNMWEFFTGSFSKDAEIPIQNKSFHLSAEKGYEIEALQIFSDQLLEYLSVHAPNFSIEFAENRINIYDDKTLSNKKDLTQLLDVGKHIIDSSGAFISRLSDDFAALHPYYKK